MLMRNPFTNGYINYPLDLSHDNIVIDYYITHDTFFCPAHTTWSVIKLLNGDTIYLPYGEKNRYDVYIVTSYYLDKIVEFPHGIYTIKYSTFIRENELSLPQ
jgi:hypothetical protein